ncbi:MAG: trimethylamine methyltransferase family protein, partial [Planctomycetes bacterium]|nr:trimethylamine methyltransferase family protein [Planctomycetota bacterium]
GETQLGVFDEELRHIRIEAWNKTDIAAIAGMCDVVTGSREASIRNPRVMGYAETRSPLCLDANMSELFIEYAKLGFPQSVDTMPCAGTTAPASSAGTLVVGLAETLSCVVLGFAVNPDVRMSIDVNPSFADMSTMVFPYASPDRMAMMAGWTQMLHEYYGCPSGIHAGKTDACVPNAQAGFEKALSTLVPVLFGATGIGTLGQVDVAGITFSPVQLVIDNEIVGYIRRILAGFEVTSETLALEVIKEVGPGGNFLMHPHTAENFRKEFYLSEIVERLPWNAWEQEEFRGIEKRAARKVEKILSEDAPHPLTADQEQQIDEIVEEYLRA